ncbi:MAG TPA: TIGR01459 family HAD-type hydrolase [Micropepsaceae bacterium]|nr:TIGR01459 family HAD-type hydrolase [Micropepsaceae bacterium]
MHAVPMNDISAAPPILNGLSEIAGDYDAAICDVWGVLHNGKEAYLRAADAMRRFRATRGPVILLSNAPRLADGVEALFDRVGLPRDFYDGIVTSGIAARADLSRRTEAGPLAMFYLGPPRDNPLYEGLNLELVGPEKAELVLCTGFYDDETETPDDYRGMLEGFRARALPFLCANPDIIVQRGDKLIFCAGAIARLYETLGGEVVYYGKPYAPVFERAVAEARALAPVKRPLVIGDGIDTDILGAYRMGLDALFIGGGIHGAELKDHPETLGKLLQKSGVTARAAMPALLW